ncbi:MULTISPECIES: hypothetical protein [Gracilibacillus]|uniref:hypothetical protein n=1 Tax=Gracilibacillus TaxID=74385 RepID=UPI00082545AF|nr:MULTISPECIES: hypothetical protein [Gracilibacillus]
MGIFFENDKRIKYPKPKALLAVQLITAMAMVGFLIYGIIQEFDPIYVGLANLLLVVTLIIDNIYYYQKTKVWDKKSWLVIIVFGLLALSLLLSAY